MHAHGRAALGSLLHQFPLPAALDRVRATAGRLHRAAPALLQGNKTSNLSIVYTPASNLRKNGEMATGQVGAPLPAPAFAAAYRCLPACRCAC